MEIECGLTASTSGSLSRKSQQSIRFRPQYELKVDEALLTLPPRAKTRESTRLLMYRTPYSDSTHAINLENVNLCVEVIPSGFKHDLPVRIRLNDNQQYRTIKSPKIASSRTILFFAPRLNPSSRQNRDMDSSGIQDEIVMANTNEIRLNYRMSIEEDVEGTFVFVAVDREAASAFGQQLVNNSPGLIEFALEPKQQMRIGVRYRRDGDVGGGEITMGTLRITIRECDYKDSLFRIQLVAFKVESSLGVLDSRAIEFKQQQQQQQKSNTLIDQLKYRNIKHTNYSIELTRPANSTNNNIYKRHIYLKNKSDTSKCMVYPVVFNTRTGKEVTFKSPSSSTSSQLSEIIYELTGIGRLRVATTSASNSHDLWTNTDGHVWIEIRRGDEMGVQIEFLNVSSSFDCVSDVRVCFFHAEFDIVAYAAYSYQQASNGANEAGVSHLVDMLSKRFVMNAELVEAGELLCSNAMNESTVSRLNFKRAVNPSSSMSTSSTSINDDSTLAALNVSSMMTRLGSKPRTTREDFLRLFRQALKCSILSISLNTSQEQSKTLLIH